MDIQNEALRYLISAALGWAVALVTFRTRLALIEKRLSDTEGSMKALTTTLRVLDRRSLYILQMLASMSKEAGQDRRISDDLIVRALAEENNNS